MALIKSITLDTGIVAEQAYFRIHEINGCKLLIQIYLTAYASEQMYLEGKDAMVQKVFTFIPSAEDDSPRWDKQAYEYLKTLPEFADVIDA